MLNRGINMKKFIKTFTILLFAALTLLYLYCYEYNKYGFSFNDVSPMAATYAMYQRRESDQSCEELVYKIMYDLNVNHEFNDKYKNVIEEDQIINLCNFDFAKYYPSKKNYEIYLNKNNYKEYMTVHKPICILSDENRFILYNHLDYTIKNREQSDCAFWCRIEVKKENDRFKIISVMPFDSMLTYPGHEKVTKDYKLFYKLKKKALDSAFGEKMN